MNYWLFPTVLAGFSLCALGKMVGRKLLGSAFFIALSLAVIAAVPGIVFVLYYIHVFYEPVFLYKFRSIPGSELAAAGAGFLAGLLQGRMSRRESLRRLAGDRLFAILLFFGLVGPFLKPILRPPHWDEFRDNWSRNVCLQTTESSCGPACAATLLQQMGKNASEKQMAGESFTSRHGTEIWYLARTLRRHGAAVEFVIQRDPAQPLPYPAIAGVRLQNTGHFIAILGREGNQYIIGDPIGGRHVQSEAAWRQQYDFTGFFLVVR